MRIGRSFPAAVSIHDRLEDELPSRIRSRLQLGSDLDQDGRRTFRCEGWMRIFLTRCVAARRVLTSSRVQQRIARKHSPRTAAYRPSTHQHRCSLDLQCIMDGIGIEPSGSWRP